MECIATTKSLDIFLEGTVFRCIACTDYENSLLPRLVKNQPDLRHQFISLLICPPHFTAVKNASLQNPAFLPAIRLLRLWADSHLLSYAFPAILSEILLMTVMQESHALNPVVAFLRTLELITTFPWRSDVFFADPTGSFTQQEKEAIEHELEIVRSQPSEKRAIFVVSPYDRNSLLTNETPDQASWSHVQIVAQRTLQKIESDWLLLPDETSLFTPRYSDFDVVITLNETYLKPVPRGVRVAGGKIKNRGEAYRSEQPKNVMLNRSRFLIGYEPEEVILDAIRKEIGNAGVAMMNMTFGRKIGISWKPSYFLPMKMSMANINDCCPVAKGEGKTREDVILVRDIFDLMRRIRAKLGDLVESIDF